MNKLYIYGDIVSDEMDTFLNETAVYPEKVINFLKEHENEDIEVRINSSGGSIFDGVTIANNLKEHKGKTTAIIDGVGASISSVIALACDEVIMNKGSFLMIHKPLVITRGNALELTETIERLNNIETTIINDFYLPKAKDGITYEMIAEKLSAETWLNSTQAAEIFNLGISEKTNFINYMGNSFKNYKNTPKEIFENSEKLKLKKIKEIEIELEV